MKNFFKAALFICLLLFVMSIVGIFFIPNNTSIKFRFLTIESNGILGEKENSIDVLFIGDSLVYSAVAPMEIWKNSGITSYDLSTSAQSVYKSYEMLNTSLKTQKPKIVFLEGNCFFKEYDIKKKMEDTFQKIFPLLEYHNRWKKLSISDLKLSRTDYNKGYRFTTKQLSASNPSKNYMKISNNKREIPDINIKYIDKIIEKCKKENIELVLLSTPSMKYYNYSKYLAVKDIAQKNNIEYIDLNIENKIDIDWSKNTQDEGNHLNYFGAKKVTSFITDYLKTKKLENHSNDEYYSSWNDELVKYEEDVKKNTQ